MDKRRTGRDLPLILLYALALGGLVALYRLVPYYLLDPKAERAWNLVPVGALALYVGSRLRSNYAYLLPLGAMLVSDLLLIVPLSRMGWPAFSLGTPIIYASFAVYVLIGRLIRESEWSPAVIGGAALLASVQFFLITNLGVWLRGTNYPHTFDGLLSCYAYAAPFYRNTLAGDLFFSALFFGVEAALAGVAALRKARQTA